tara:strand:+ start:22028 stop:22399 length:372 start_codon:yes stop_codon:yes gene_type:complete
LEIIELKRNNIIYLILFFFLLLGCKDSKIPIGAEWKGGGDLMLIDQKEIEMIYGVSIQGNKVFDDGLYEVIKKQTTEVITKLKVEDIEIEERSDGTIFCRIWGATSDGNKAYVLADNCSLLYY